MIHLLSDEEFQLTLRRIRERLVPEGRVIIRATIPQPRVFAWKRWVEEQRIKLGGGTSRFRTQENLRAILIAAGFTVAETEESAPGHEEMWFLAFPRETQNPRVNETDTESGEQG